MRVKNAPPPTPVFRYHTPPLSGNVINGVGEAAWYVDFDKCVPYFAENSGCAICIEVCPWSEPGRGFTLSERLLAKRQL